METKENFFKYLKDCEKKKAPCILNTREKIKWYQEYMEKTFSEGK